MSREAWVSGLLLLVIPIGFKCLVFMGTLHDILDIERNFVLLPNRGFEALMVSGRAFATPVNGRPFASSALGYFSIQSS